MLVGNFGLKSMGDMVEEVDMSGNSFGNILKMTTFGESHGEALGVIIDGMPANIQMDGHLLQKYVDRRRPGQKGTTCRQELDSVQILSGIFQGKTLGTPIAIMVQNRNQRSQDYSHLQHEYRVGHGDKTYFDKYGIRDYRGGGRASGRETVARVIGGYFASLILPQLVFIPEIHNIGELTNCPWPLDDKALTYLENLQQVGESVGGRVSIKILKVPASLGEPVFDKLKAELAKAVMSIGAITSFSYGVGEEFANLKGSQCCKDRSLFGGIEGGISNGDDLFINFTVKPTSTVGKSALEGRHDPCIIPRVIPVVEAMITFTLANFYLLQRAYEQH